jgi:hypothetical protein
MRLNLADSRKALMLEMINFSQLLENLLRWVFATFTLRWPMDRAL